MIVDTLDRHDPRQFGLSGLFARVAEPLTRRGEPGEQAAAIDETDVQIAETYDVVTGLAFSNSNKFIHQRLTDEDELALPFDFARAADAADLVIGVILGVFLARRREVLQFSPPAGRGQILPSNRRMTSLNVLTSRKIGARRPDRFHP